MCRFHLCVALKIRVSVVRFRDWPPDSKPLPACLREAAFLHFQLVFYNWLVPVVTLPLSLIRPGGLDLPVESPQGVGWYFILLV